MDAQRASVGALCRARWLHEPFVVPEVQAAGGITLRRPYESVVSHALPCHYAAMAPTCDGNNLETSLQYNAIMGLSGAGGIIAYYRVSARMQGFGGLGMDAQRTSVEAYSTSARNPRS